MPGISPFRGAAAGIGPLRCDLHALATVTPLAQVTLRSQVGGELLHFTEGQAVARGQLLAEIDAPLSCGAGVRLG